MVVRHRRKADHYKPSSDEIEHVPLLDTSSLLDS